MNKIQCGLPFIQNNKNPQTNASIALRITAVAAGSIAATVGFLAVFAGSLPVISMIGNAAGFSMVGGGSLMMLTGAAIKQVKQPKPSTFEQSQPPKTPTPFKGMMFDMRNSPRDPSADL